MQELTKFEIDTHNIIINQVLYDDEGEHPSPICPSDILVQTRSLTINRHAL